jgi:hypothetical protein
MIPARAGWVVLFRDGEDVVAAPVEAWADGRDEGLVPLSKLDREHNILHVKWFTSQRVVHCPTLHALCSMPEELMSPEQVAERDRLTGLLLP